MKKDIFIIACACITIAGCKEKNIDMKNEQEEFPVTTATLVDTSYFKEYTAEIYAVQNVEIRARVNGYLENILIDEGKNVAKDQLLFTINSSEYSEQVIKASALHKSALVELSAAKLTMNNVKSLADKNIVSQTELDLAKNKVDVAQAKVDEMQAELSKAKLSLSYAEIKAPFAGVVNRIPHKIGSLINEGTLLTSISDNNEVFAYFQVSEKEYLNYASSLNKDSAQSKIVSLILANGQPHIYNGIIETIEGEIEQSTGNIAFRARFKNHGKLLKHGASGKIRLSVKYDNALIIPQKAVFELQDKMYAYVVDTDNRIKARNITALQRIPHIYIVTSGLKPGDKVIYEGIQNLKEDMKIKPKFIAMSSILNQIVLKK